MSPFPLLVERDKAVATVWRTIFEGRCDWLVKQIQSFQMTRESVRAELSVAPPSVHRAAFQTILRNRVQRGGIMAPGASLMLSGENGKGITSRWYPQTLANRIEALHRIRDRVTFHEGDAMHHIQEFVDDSDAAFFVDPPYTAGGKRAGSRLYSCHEVNHADLFRLMACVRGAALLTYDDAPEVRAMAHRWGFDVNPILMKNTHHSVMAELAIGKGFSESNRQAVLVDKLRKPPVPQSLFA